MEKCDIQKRIKYEDQIYDAMHRVAKFIRDEGSQSVKDEWASLVKGEPALRDEPENARISIVFRFVRAYIDENIVNLPRMEFTSGGWLAVEKETKDHLIDIACKLHDTGNFPEKMWSDNMKKPLSRPAESALGYIESVIRLHKYHAVKSRDGVGGCRTD